MKLQHGKYRQRVGKLIEEFICKKYSLFYNKKQHKRGYYDAYDKNTVYEIKGAINTSKRFFIRSINHKNLVYFDGSYIFVIYRLIDNDSDLKLITDIEIDDILFISAKDVNERVINSKKEYFNKYVGKFYYRLSYKELNND